MWIIRILMHNLILNEHLYQDYATEACNRSQTKQLFSAFQVMYYSEYLRNKMRASPKIISPPTGRSSGLWTQMQRYKNSSGIVTPISAGQMLELSSDGVVAHKGQAAVCCAKDLIKVPTRIAGECCDLVSPLQNPRGFYGPVKPECCPVNLPPVGPNVPCCPNLPKNTYLVTYTKKPRCK